MELQQELDYFKSIKEDLLKRYEDKFALIKGRELVNTFTTWEEAFNAGIERFGNVPFLIKPIQEEDERIQFPALVVGAINAKS
ncbi:MAG: hypothetical protein NTU59_01425 [Coprothermobacterota bacterium]|nr:hypothetical protein [Coprothermobacterota bacterium]